MNKYIKNSKDILLSIDNQFGNKLLYKRRVKMIAHSYQVMPDSKELDTSKIIITTKDNVEAYEHCPKLIICNDVTGIIRQVIAVDNNDELGFTPLIEDYILELHNNNIGIEVVARKTNFFNPMRGKQRGLQAEMPAYVGTIESDESFRLAEIEYLDMQATVYPRDFRNLDATKEMFFVFYHRGMLSREF